MKHLVVVNVNGVEMLHAAGITFIHHPTGRLEIEGSKSTQLLQLSLIITNYGWFPLFLTVKCP